MYMYMYMLATEDSAHVILTLPAVHMLSTEDNTHVTLCLRLCIRV